MAKIWPVYEGREPTRGGPWAELPARQAIALFELRPEDFVSNLSMTPRFGDNGQDLQYRGYKHIVVQLDRKEGEQQDWRPGFYRSKIKPEDAFGRLIQQAAAAELGDKNVVRVDYESTTDSQGRAAIEITVVIAPGALNKIKGEASLNALVRLQERLREMREERTPIIQFATQDELAMNVHH
jgi:hypothetical protein